MSQVGGVPGRRDAFSGGDLPLISAQSQKPPSRLESIAHDMLGGKDLEAAIKNNVPWGFRGLAKTYIGNLKREALQGPSENAYRDMTAIAILKAAGKTTDEAKGTVNNLRMDAAIREAKGQEGPEAIFIGCTRVHQIAMDPATTPAKKQEAIKFLEDKRDDKNINWDSTIVKGEKSTWGHGDNIQTGQLTWDKGRKADLEDMIKELKGG